VATSQYLRIAVVDDDLWIRTGRVTALESAGLQVVAACDHQEALSSPELWSDIDVVLVDAWDGREDWDRFPGVAVVESIRLVRSREQTLVIVISGHITNDLLRLRMAEAGADFFYGHSELRGPEDLLRAIRQPDDDRRARPVDSSRLAALGASSSSRLNAALHDIERRGLKDAFRPRTSQKALPVGRRTLITTRRRVSEIARIARSRPGSTDGPPEWRQVTRLVNLARGVSETDRE
jgi:CheY-like chemotaxis protein